MKKQTYDKRKIPKYDTHVWCVRHKWIPKEKVIQDSGGQDMCPKCHKAVRHKPRGSKYRKIRNNTREQDD